MKSKKAGLHTSSYSLTTRTTVGRRRTNSGLGSWSTDGSKSANRSAAVPILRNVANPQWPQSVTPRGNYPRSQTSRFAQFCNQKCEGPSSSSKRGRSASLHSLLKWRRTGLTASLPPILKIKFETGRSSCTSRALWGVLSDHDPEESRRAPICNPKTVVSTAALH